MACKELSPIALGHPVTAFSLPQANDAYSFGGRVTSTGAFTQWPYQTNLLDKHTMIHDEETRQEVICPYCGAVDSCSHLVVVFDKTFCECMGGIFFERSSEFEDIVETKVKSCLMASDEFAPTWNDVDLDELWDMCQDDQDLLVRRDDPASMDEVSIEPGPIVSLAISCLEEAGARPNSVNLVSDGGPGQSSAYEILYAEDPQLVISKGFEILQKRLDSGA